MDIHLPKPFHNWREFLKEYGIIVLGVLTALGLEQAIESWHAHAQVKGAADAVDAELRQELAKAGYQLSFTECSDRQLTALSDAINQGDQAEVRRLLSEGQFARPMGWSNSAWQALHASDVSNHLDPKRQRDYPILYSLKSDMVTAQSRLVSSHFRLEALAQGELSKSDSNARAELAEMTGAWHQLNSEEYALRSIAKSLLGLEPSKADLSRVPNDGQLARCMAAAAALGPARKS